MLSSSSFLQRLAQKYPKRMPTPSARIPVVTTAMATVSVVYVANGGSAASTSGPVEIFWVIMVGISLGNETSVLVDSQIITKELQVPR